MDVLFVSGQSPELTKAAAAVATVFRDTLVGNIRDLVKLMPSLNVTEDPALDQFRREIEDTLMKYTADTLRLSTRARTETAAAANNILQRMKDFMPEIHVDAADEVAFVPVEPPKEVCFLL